MMEFGVISFQITDAPIELFEHLSLSCSDTNAFCREFSAKINSEFEIVFISTCNRLEFCIAAPDVFQAPRAENGCPHFAPDASLRVAGKSCLFARLLDFLAARARVQREALVDFSRTYHGLQAVNHLFRTAAGLNSIAIGETQIQGQLKDAYMQAKSEGFARNHLSFVFEAALRAGKRARAETGIDRAQISLGRFAIDSVQNHSGIHKNANVVILGTGKMAKNGAHYLHNMGIANLTFLSRHPEKRREQLAGFHARVEHLDTLPAHIPSADLVFSAYGTHELLITPELLQPVLLQRTSRLFIIDIGLPRDVDPQVARLSGVELIDFTYLQQMKREKSFRESPKVVEAEKIVGEELRAFEIEERVRGASSLISCFRRRAESIRQEELQKALRRLPNLAAAEQEVIYKLTYNIVSKVLRNPTLKIRQKAETGELDDTYAKIITEMFN